MMEYFLKNLDFRTVINKKNVVVTGRSAAAAPLLKHSATAYSALCISLQSQVGELIIISDEF